MFSWQRPAETTRVPGASDGVHLYAVEWSETTIRVLADGREYFRFEKPPGATAAEWPFAEKFRVLSTWRSEAPGVEPKAWPENIWPQRLEVDYVRVYERRSK